MFNQIVYSVFACHTHSDTGILTLLLVSAGLHTPEIRSSLCLRRDGGRTPRMRDGGTTDAGTWRQNHPPSPQTWAGWKSGRDPCRWREISAPAPRRGSPERSRYFTYCSFRSLLRSLLWSGNNWTSFPSGYSYISRSSAATERKPVTDRSRVCVCEIVCKSVCVCERERPASLFEIQVTPQTARVTHFDLVDPN